MENTIFLKSKILALFKNHNSLSITTIKSLLNKINYPFTTEDLYKAIYDLYVEQGMLIRNDHLGKEATFTLVNEYLFDSSYTRHYYNFEESNQDLEFILISDTHIGDKNLEDFNLINKIYDYAKENNIKQVFHLGDIFSGYQSKEITSDEIIRQLELFLTNYPNTSKEGITTYANLGNHDEWIHGFINLNKYCKYKLDHIFDLRQLGRYNQSFHVIPRDSYQITTNNKIIHFSHRLFYSVIHQNMHLNEVNDFSKYEFIRDDTYSVLFSGHLHKGFIYSSNTYNGLKEKLYLGVPSLSKINEGALISYKIKMTKDEMLITPLIGNNKKILEQEELVWNFSKSNKPYRKIFK